MNNIFHLNNGNEEILSYDHKDIYHLISKNLI